MVIQQIACPAEGRTRGTATDADARSAAPVRRVRLGNTDFRFKLNCSFGGVFNSDVVQVSILPGHEAKSLGIGIPTLRDMVPIRFKLQDSQTSVHNIKVFGALNRQDNGDYTLLRRQIQPNGI